MKQPFRRSYSVSFTKRAQNAAQHARRSDANHANGHALSLLFFSDEQNAKRRQRNTDKRQPRPAGNTQEHQHHAQRNAGVADNAQHDASSAWITAGLYALRLPPWHAITALPLSSYARTDGICQRTPLRLFRRGQSLPTDRKDRLRPARGRKVRSPAWPFRPRSSAHGRDEWGRRSLYRAAPA